ncbi:MAG: carbon-nitrogen family hydrolase [Verrucomicrobiales bacterium]|nr:carbon-nitrogen family hydrolase [Verrucomicrobiales bacterium]
MSGPMVVGIQMDLAWEEPSANRSRAEHRIREAAPPQGSLVVLPEMFTTGFTLKAVPEPEDGPTELWMQGVARRHGVWLLGGLIRQRPSEDAGNELIVCDPEGRTRANYRKQRPFVPGDEHRAYAGGSAPTVFAWGDVKVAPFICYDLRFPELFREAARQRPELYVVIASWPDKRIHHWVRLLQARAIENQAYIIGVNRVGDDPQFHYNGRSLVADASGELLADAGHDEGAIRANLDLASLRNYREKLPFLADLRG